MGEVKDEELASYYYACGKPVVSTNLPTAVPFVNLHNKTGLVVPPRNPDALAGAINELLASAELRRVYGENAKQRVEKEFTKEKMAKEVLIIYKEVL